MNWGFPNIKQFNNFVPSQFTVSVDREILNENLALFYSMSRIMCHFVSSLHFIFVWSVREIKPHWGRPPPENSMRKPQHSSTAEDFINMTQINRTLGLFQASKFLQWFPCWDCSLCCDWGEMIASRAWRHTHPSAHLQTPGLFQHPHAAKQVLWKPPGHPLSLPSILYHFFLLCHCISSCWWSWPPCFSRHHIEALQHTHPSAGTPHC